MKCSITSATGRVSRGKANDCTRFWLPVIDFAPSERLRLKNWKRNTPITTYAT